MTYSNGYSFGESIGNSADLGGGNSYGGQARDGSRPPSAAWLFTVLTWRI